MPLNDVRSAAAHLCNQINIQRETICRKIWSCDEDDRDITTFLALYEASYFCCHFHAVVTFSKATWIQIFEEQSSRKKAIEQKPFILDLVLIKPKCVFFYFLRCRRSRSIACTILMFQNGSTLAIKIFISNFRVHFKCKQPLNTLLTVVVQYVIFSK